MRKSQRTLTSGQVAKILDVAPKTVSNWIDSGRLKGYRIPISKDRRVRREDLDEFLHEHGIPNLTATVLLVGLPSTTAAAVVAELSDHGIVSCCASTSFSAGLLVERYRPRIVIVDLALGQVEAGCVAAGLETTGAVLETVPSTVNPEFLVARIRQRLSQDGGNLPCIDHDAKPRS